MVSPLPVLITLAQAKKHLRIQDDDENIDIYLKIEHATGLVLNYLDRDDDDWTDTMVSWTVETVPKPVQAAILTQLAELYRFRGDDEKQPERQRGYLSPAVEAYLFRFHDPGIA